MDIGDGSRALAKSDEWFSFFVADPASDFLNLRVLDDLIRERGDNV